MQEPTFKPTAPQGSGDMPPPYSAVMAANATGVQPGGYPHIGFVPPANVSATNTYPHPATIHATTENMYRHTAPPNMYPHPPEGYPQQANMMLGATPAQIPVNVILTAPVGTEPANMFCTSCSQQIITKVDYRTSWHTHLIAGIICFSTMFFSMCCLGLVPYCLNSCKNAEHYCPNCNAYLGKYERC